MYEEPKNSRLRAPSGSQWLCCRRHWTESWRSCCCRRRVWICVPWPALTLEITRDFTSRLGGGSDSAGAVLRSFSDQSGSNLETGWRDLQLHVTLTLCFFFPNWFTLRITWETLLKRKVGFPRPGHVRETACLSWICVPFWVLCLRWQSASLGISRRGLCCGLFLFLWRNAMSCFTPDDGEIRLQFFVCLERNP